VTLVPIRATDRHFLWRSSSCRSWEDGRRFLLNFSPP